MVEDRITDGKRVAQLLASELTGLETPPLDRVGVVDATPEVEPTADGTAAYGVAIDGDRSGTVTVFPDGATLSVDGSLPEAFEPADGIDVERGDEGVVVRIEHAAAVKGAVDALVAITAA